MRSSDSFAIQRQPMRKPVATPRADSHRDGAVAALLRVSFRFRDSSVVTRFLRLHRPVMLAAIVTVVSTQPVLAAGNLTLPFADPHPRITSSADRAQRQHGKLDRPACTFRGARSAHALAFGRSLRLDRARQGPLALGSGQSLDEQPAGSLPAPARLSWWSALEPLVWHG